MSNQNLVPRTHKSGSIGIPTKQWGSGSFANLDVGDITITTLQASNAELTGSLSGSFSGSASGTFSGEFSGISSGSFNGNYTGTFVGDGSGLNNITALDTGSLLGIQRIYDSGSKVDDHFSIADALASSVPGDTVFIGAGTYYEAGLVVPTGIQLIGKTATSRDVIIDGSGSNAEFIVKVLDDAQLAHFEVDMDGNTEYGVILQGTDTVGKNPFAQDVSIKGTNNDTQVPLYITGSGFTVAKDISFITKGDFVGDSILFDGVDGLTFYGESLRYSAQGRSLFKSTGSQGIVEISGVEVEGNAVDYTYGFDIDSNVSLQLNNFNWSNDVSSSVYINENSAGANVTFMAGNAEGSENDVLIHPSASGVGSDFDFAAVQFRGERYTDQTLGTWSSEAKVHGIRIDEGLNDSPNICVIGDFSVGSPNFPSSLYAGEGMSTVLNMKILSSGSNGWVDQTTDAFSNTGSSFKVFPVDSGSGATWYIGNIQRKFSGIENKMTVPQINGEIAGVWEYSSGSTWNEFEVLNSDAQFPYNQYAQRVWSSGSTTLNNIRFNNLLVSNTGSFDWTRTTVNGVQGYWVRYRLTSDLSQTAELEQVKLNTSSTKINGDGYLERFGQGEYKGSLVWHKRLEYTLSGRTPSPSTINISSNISLEYPQNALVNQAIDGSGGIIKVPTGLNTSRDLEVTFTFTPSANAIDANRQIELELDVVEIKTGDVLNGTLPETSYSKIIPISQTDGGRVKSVTFKVNTPNLIPREFFALSYFRDATNGNPDDTYTGNIRIIAVDIEGYFWR